MLMITGAAGFIGSSFTRSEAQANRPLCLVDKLTYAGNLMSIDAALAKPNVSFHRFDIGDQSAMQALLHEKKCTAIVNFAAETHVDRSIDVPEVFAETNVLDTVRLLQATADYWRHLPELQKAKFRFVHISTDEVYGSLGPGESSAEQSLYSPNSPYAASKAASDHFVRAFHQTYGLPTLIIHSSNNYGPYQFPEKLIPLMILNAVANRPLPVYGDGLHVRDWLHVEDHCDAIRCVLEDGRVGETYNVGGGAEVTNLEVVQSICSHLADFTNRPESDVRKLISHVEDRPGHDQRYALDTSKIRSELGWQPRRGFAEGLRDTVKWYLDNSDWVDSVRSGAYRRLGLGPK